MDISVNYLLFKWLLKGKSRQERIEYFQRLFPRFELFSMSTDWEYNSEYICKFKGVYGDIIFYWK